MTRLYQWLRRWAMGFAEPGREGDGRRTVRAETTVQVTVEEQRRLLLLTGAATGLEWCPFCGQPLARGGTTPETAGTTGDTDEKARRLK